ncbi:HNH endonuclease signature motif containing protein [Brevibacterium paucivorans]|uniref:HNH endonuclease n=1 Tax=Brevibacterium paucivorans TaxID=170994 RepID=A0A2N6VPK1_9MICO|nr:HNH endonuclease signature motif containing protein [Brevibacterium paucivorans]PMD06052.1 HNH endonuclease [Brevibacterium paucivorans]
MTTTDHHVRNDMYDGPAVELFETVKTTTRIMDEARVKQAEAVAALISTHVTPVDDFTDGMHAVFTSNPGAGPLVTNGKASSNKNPATGNASSSSSAFGPVATTSQVGARGISADGPRATVGIDDVVACVALPSGEVCTVASVERVPDELPTPTEGVLAKVLDCTRAQVVTQVRKIMTAVVLMPKLWSLARQGVIGFDRVLYTAGRVGRAGVCIPVFDDMLTSKRVDVSWKTFKRHVTEVLAMLTTPEARAANAHRNRSVSYWVNDDGTATLSLTGPVLEMEAFYQRVRGTARAIMANHIEPFTATLTDEQQALFITENNGDVSEVRVGDLGRVEVDDDRLMDQLTLDLITGAKPSTTLRVRVTRTGKQAPIKVTYTTPEGASADASGSGDADGSVWADRREAKQAEDVYELELCVSMPEKEEWLRAQAGITVTVPVVHFLLDTPPPGTEGRPEEQRSERQRSGKDPGVDKHRPENHDLGRHETEEYSFRVEENEYRSSETYETEEQTFGSHEIGERAFVDQGNSVSSGAGPGNDEQLFDDQGTGMSPGASSPPGDGEPLSDGAGSELDYGLPVRVDPGARVPVMMNNRVPLDAKTADRVITRAKWVYRMFTDPETGVVLESTPTKYYIPAALKRMVEARHPECSAPWCAVPARVCEKDHIEPFNHQDPENGGLTVMENLHPLCKRHHQEKTQKRLRVDKMDDGSLAWVFPRIGAMLVYPPESRINQLQYERLLEYFDTGDQDISHTIHEYLATEHETAHRPQPETVRTPDSTTTNDPEPRTAPSSEQVNGNLSAAYPREVTDEYALAGELFNGDTRPWEPSKEPPPF